MSLVDLRYQKQRRSPEQLLQHLKTFVLDIKPSVCVERARFVTQAYQKYQNAPVVLRRAHALAHTADLILVLARNRYINETDLGNMLWVISVKIIHSTHHVYIHGEDEMLASAVLEILRRDLIPMDQVGVSFSSVAKTPV